ncbi:hypothetical protein XMM379_002337 [Aliiroseovarius sp. xm-m-379]|nr:hypothetical protein [Aliiroseovarius sp. xm-d-517]NRP25638.1 hypothetical protein [Aliiroseovarius sp. xm-m-379]NRP31144.1 hypothetical protein [Aliiroseovarius sp. xm-m-314]NRP34437.1 hypothetical protein [Aliiroseovarius sp. xm-a-104]NRP41871.1 hypothetical protein [Aliiroseovarius sp. xm-m-339-2]NRP45196.1 hypothetical protein [Aliiroseovarius sp. xm-m-378]NRP50900.1 hypothetical protein [Aliiroseovarius sp. xm-m-354]NRP62877.1 hypothetical protein [Aliiroseovarius sp. xm-a-151]NRP66
MSLIDRLKWALREKPRLVARITLVYGILEIFALYVLFVHPEWWVEGRLYSVWIIRLLPLILPLTYIWGVLTLVDQKRIEES